MTGESARFESVQPGGRSPAPGELAVVQAFINSHYDLEDDHGADLLATPAALAGWLGRHRLLGGDVAAADSDVSRALAAREALRDLARANGGAPRPIGVADALGRLGRAARGAPVEVGFGIDGPYFVAAHDGVAGAIGVLMALTARAITDGSWSQLKVCPGANCGWAFYDHSRNQAGRWCSMSVCGGRAKARAHYRRRRAAT
jgi:predicted RNA-binding Zn ribbon-like protein